MVARWLVAAVRATADTEAPVLAGAHIHLQLRTSLISFLGQTGFDSLWTRALHLAASPLPRTAGVLEHLPLQPDGWSAALTGFSEGEALEILAAIVTSFVTLLFTFVGAPLGVRLLQQIWPALPSFESDAQTGDVTP